jgi:hypothetical protein
MVTLVDDVPDGVLGDLLAVELRGAVNVVRLRAQHRTRRTR